LCHSQFGYHSILHHRRAPEFPAPDDQLFIQQSALFQVNEQIGDGAVGLLALDGKRLVYAFSGRGAVVIPAPIIQSKASSAP
jgi:hypothetical protein